MGDRFIGRIEPIVDYRSNTLEIKNIWYEDTKITEHEKAKLDESLLRFAEFNGCNNIVLMNEHYI